MQLLLMLQTVEILCFFMNIFEEFLYFSGKHCWIGLQKFYNINELYFIYVIYKLSFF